MNNEYDWSQYITSYSFGNIDTKLTVPVFIKPQNEGELIDSLYPEIVMQPVMCEPDESVVYYFEFDTKPSFDTPNLWRKPMLKPVPLSENLTSPQGRFYYLTQSQLRDDKGEDNFVKFPFRVSSMRLPEDWDDLDELEFEKQSIQ